MAANEPTADSACRKCKKTPARSILADAVHYRNMHDRSEGAAFARLTS
jgi:hypothetical protein